MSRSKKITIMSSNHSINGERIDLPLDEKNLSSDWVEEFIFNGECTTKNEKVVGFGEFLEQTYDVVAIAEYDTESNGVTYVFPERNYFWDYELEFFVNELRDFFFPSENDNTHLEIDVIAEYTNDGKTFIPLIEVEFYTRAE